MSTNMTSRFGRVRKFLYDIKWGQLDFTEVLCSFVV